MVQLIDQNFRLHACTIAGQTKGMKVYSLENLVYIDSNLSCDTFNIIHIYNGLKLKKEELADALNFYQSNQLDYCIWISAEQLTMQVEEYFEDFNLMQQNQETGMMLNISNYQPADSAEFLNIKIVENENELHDYAQVIASNWIPPDQNILRYYKRTAPHYLNRKNGIILIVFYLENNPVGTVEMFPTDLSTIGLYGLATLQAFRGKGIGSSLMTFALNKARELNYQKVVLQASEEAIGIYQRLGFEVMTKYYEYA